MSKIKYLKPEDARKLVKKYGLDCLIVIQFGSYSEKVYARWYSGQYESIIAVVPRESFVSQYSVSFGSDPEFLIKKGREIIPSRAVIPAGGIDFSRGKIVRDGIQAEINPRQDSCRQISGRNFGYCLSELITAAESAKAKLCTSVGAMVSGSTFERIPEEDKQFGCNPTDNSYETTERPDGMYERFRSCGGHIHLGFSMPNIEVSKLVQLMDIIAGNTCVLIDRDPANKARREIYGRAGEYRKKSYGIEYRVLSNFWTHHYTLWSMASGLLRQAISMHERADEIIALFDMQDIRDAINNNDKKLALKNFRKFSKYLKDNQILLNNGLTSLNVDTFEKWALETKPMSRFGKFDYNSFINYGLNKGFEKFLEDYKPKPKKK